jgi:N-succinyldiaminopimelate aminotransferase
VVRTSLQRAERLARPGTHVLPVNGTREALFAFTQTVVNRGDDGWWSARTRSIRSTKAQRFSPGPSRITCRAWMKTASIRISTQFPDIWKRCQILFLCSPGNPTGALIPVDTLKKLIALADEHDFVIAADECYSELYFDEQTPPAGLLSACVELGRKDFKRCVVFHSLSKRSNLPGLRSGFVAGDADILKASCSIALTTAARCRFKPNWRALPRGTTKNTCAPTVALYREKYRRGAGNPQPGHGRAAPGRRFLPVAKRARR